MSQDRSEQVSPQDRGMSRLVAGLREVWRAVAVAYARLTPSTPPFTGAEQSAPAAAHTKRDG